LIEFLQGELFFKGTNYVVVRAGGIGYRLYISALTLELLPRLHEEVTLFAHLHVREDEYSLFGFANLEERELFNELLSISGIGPKLALAVLSKYHTAELKRIIFIGDAGALTNISGVGKKTAERIILELKDKLGKQELQALPDAVTPSGPANIRREAVNALLALGYSLTEAQKAVPANEAGESGATVEELIRTALKAMAKY